MFIGSESSQIFSHTQSQLSPVYAPIWLGIDFSIYKATPYFCITLYSGPAVEGLSKIQYMQ